ncbi:alcohol dehydrogenase catalytic domain-containing protein [Streptomyces sp. NPDC048309]|uniref:zinc-dependent alcohol dehydrogenase n=1 Tax=Streptomyces sp. NPDC048309 TaxID=3154618 RepID=UPI0033FAAE43
MRALVFHGPRNIRLEERPPPTPRQDEVVVRPFLTGLCGTDRGIYLGQVPCRPPRVLGHESWGVVDAVGDQATWLAVGDRVMINPTMWCGHCQACRRGHGYRCRHKTELEMGVSCDGTAVDLVAVPARFVHRLPPELPGQRAVLLEPLACVLAALKKAGTGWQDRVIVLGSGPIGALSAMAAARFTAAVTLVEPDPYRSRFARERLSGVTVRQSLPDDRPDPAPTVVVDTTGVLTERALVMVEDGGHVLLLGLRACPRASLQAFDLVTRNLTLIGSCDYNQFDLPGVIEFSRTLCCEVLVTHVFPLTEYLRALSLLGTEPGKGYQAMKVALGPGMS